MLHVSACSFIRLGDSDPDEALEPGVDESPKENDSAKRLRNDIFEVIYVNRKRLMYADFFANSTAKRTLIQIVKHHLLMLVLPKPKLIFFVTVSYFRIDLFMVE